MTTVEQHRTFQLPGWDTFKKGSYKCNSQCKLLNSQCKSLLLSNDPPLENQTNIFPSVIRFTIQNATWVTFYEPPSLVLI